jgi:hypothetical protein
MIRYKRVSPPDGADAPVPPKPNTQAVSWFFAENKKGTLRLKPKYQRNPIWSPGQKCFLIDSIISGCPLPQVFLNIKSEGTGTNRETIYEVVDGQQRLRAILEFLNDQWPLIATAAKAYPVSSIYKPFIGKRYSELPSSLQEQIWGYALSVQELRNWTDAQIRALFRRLNYVVEKLNQQELRHSQYFGEFVTTVEKLATLPFWDDVGLFTRRDSQRMKDVEFVSELFIVVIAGIQDQQETLNEFYAKYDVGFPKKSTFTHRFRRTLDSLRTLQPFDVRFFRKKADFYALFAAAASLNEGRETALDLSPAREKLIELEEELARPQEELGDSAARYLRTVIEGPNKAPKREQRMRILKEILAAHE